MSGKSVTTMPAECAEMQVLCAFRLPEKPYNLRFCNIGALAFEELPAVCQAYFKRAQACYAKADEKAALFHKGNTEFLRQSLPAATVKQREEMCKMADEAFADKAKALKCE